MILRTVVLLLFAGPVWAHELAGPHAHPHGDWNGLVAVLLGAAALSTIWLLRRSYARRANDDEHDPR